MVVAVCPELAVTNLKKNCKFELGGVLDVKLERRQQDCLCFANGEVEGNGLQTTSVKILSGSNCTNSSVT